MSTSDEHQAAQGATAPRPEWRFTGRRGTPVNERDHPSAALPAEIRSVVQRMTREAAPQPAATAAVAGAPVPVERRAARGPVAAVVSTTPIDAVPAAPEQARHPEIVEAAGGTPPRADGERSRPELTPAQAKKLAKARAKQRAKAAKRGAPIDAEPDVAAAAPRHLFARDVFVEPASVEPTPPPADAVPAPLEAAELSPVEAPAAPPASAPPQVASPAVPAEPPVAEHVPLTPDQPAERAAVPEPELVIPPAPTTGTPPPPDPVAATTDATQAAWQLGHLPILAPTPTTDEPEVGDDPLAAVLHVAAAPAPREPEPAQATPASSPRDTALPRDHAIERESDVVMRSSLNEPSGVDEPLALPRELTVTRAREARDGSGTAQSTDPVPDTARARTQARRDELAELLASLSELGSR